MGSRGLTLIECAVGMAAAGVVTAAAGMLLLAGLRLERNTTAGVEARRQLHVAAAVLRGELAALSAEAGDLLAASDSTLTVRALRGFGIACAVPGGQRLVLDDSLLSLLRTIDPARDSVRWFAEGDPRTAADDQWALAGVSSTGGGSCASGSSGTTLTLSGGAALGLTRAGAPVRVFEHLQYRRYRDATGQIMLGARSPAAGGGWNTTSPLAGPFRSGGISFLLLDSTGAATAAADSAALVMITLRSAAPASESLTVAVAVRGALR